MNTYYSECLEVEQENREFDDLVDVIRRIHILTGGLKVQDKQVVQTIWVGLHRVVQLPGRVWLLQYGLST